MSVDPYLDLVTSAHRRRPKFSATITAIVEPIAALRELTAGLPASFDLDTAIGAQLDVVGEWVGISRFIVTPVENVWFSFDTAGLGFDEAEWLGPFDPVTGLTRLGDDDYRRLIRARIALNSWDGTPAGAQAALDILFTSPSTRVFYDDRGDMTASIAVSGATPTTMLLVILAGGYLPLKPAGMDVSTVITSVPGTACFGFDADNDFISGFDEGAWARPVSETLTI